VPQGREFKQKIIFLKFLHVGQTSGKHRPIKLLVFRVAQTEKATPNQDILAVSTHLLLTNIYYLESAET
jgi:hypothetical protein